jgi:hypothetical protein
MEINIKKDIVAILLDQNQGRPMDYEVLAARTIQGLRKKLEVRTFPKATPRDKEMGYTFSLKFIEAIEEKMAEMGLDWVEIQQIDQVLMALEAIWEEQEK